MRSTLEGLMPHAQDLATIMKKQLIRAKLEIKMDKLTSQVDKNKADDVLSVILTPSNVDQIVLELKDKRKVKAGQFVWKKHFEIETETLEDTIKEVYRSLFSCLSELRNV